MFFSIPGVLVSKEPPKNKSLASKVLLFLGRVFLVIIELLLEYFYIFSKGPYGYTLIGNLINTLWFRVIIKYHY